MARQADVVCVPYDLLMDPDSDLTEQLRQGFGPFGLGIITVSGVPGFPEKREALLPLADAFAKLPDAAKAACEDEASQFSVGWSHGKEALRSGIRDVNKGSFYANPLQDDYCDVDPRLAAEHPAYFRPNIWPHQALPALQPAFKSLGALIVDVGLRLAEHCSRYVVQQLEKLEGCPLSRQQLQQLDFAGQLRGSRCHKARLLHYFPVQQQQQHGASGQQQQQQQQQASSEEDWCGWHLDHGQLTGLCSAMYVARSRQVPTPDPAAGLYIQSRDGSVVQARIPPTHLAYQLGQVMAIQSGGLLRATPHYVRAAAAGDPSVSRNTFAVFMQPEVTTELVAPAIPRALEEQLCLDSGRWLPGMCFGEFAELTLGGYYRPPGAGDDVGVSGRMDQAGRGLASKDVAPAAVHAAVQAAAQQLPRRQAQVVVFME